jgi:hypothetical protein
MSISLLLNGLPEVRTLVVSDRSGAVGQVAGAEVDSVAVAAVASLAVIAFETSGGMLMLGALQSMLVKGKKTSALTVVRGTNLVSVFMDQSVSTSAVEKRLSEVSDSAFDVTVLSEEDLIVVSDERPSEMPTGVPRPVKRPSAESNTAWVGEAMQLARASVWSKFRRALARGRMVEVESLAEQVAAGLQDAVEARVCKEQVQRLTDGIGAVLGGDNLLGIRQLKMVALATKADVSLRWVAHLWSARAAAGSGDIESAKSYGQAALDLSDQLDLESRAGSLSTMAEIAFLGKNAQWALDLLATARSLFSQQHNAREVAKSWLMEAKVLSENGRPEQALHAAEQARVADPSWPNPVLFLTRKALENNRLAQAEGHLRTLLARKPTPPEAEKEKRILALIQQGKIPLLVVNEYYRLVDAPPNDAVIRSLQEMVAQFPTFVPVRDALAWKLLKSGQYEEAGNQFNFLAELPSLASDERSSAMLGIGCVAKAGIRGQKRPTASLLAAVSAVHTQVKNSETPPIPRVCVAPGVDLITKSGIGDVRASSPSLSERANGGLWMAERPSGNFSAAFSGELRQFALPDLLEFLRGGRRTGTLVMSSAAGAGGVSLRKGLITGAASPNAPSLGQLLVNSGKISEPQLNSVLKSQDVQGNERLLGSMIVELGLLDADSVRRGLLDQIVHCLHELVQWVDGQFAFESEIPEESHASQVDVEIDPQQVLLQVFKEVDEKANSRPS